MTSDSSVGMQHELQRWSLINTHSPKEEKQGNPNKMENLRVWYARQKPNSLLYEPTSGLPYKNASHHTHPYTD